MDVLRSANLRAASGKEVLHLELGEPAGGAPSAAIKAAQAAMGERNLGYTDAFGIAELRDGVADLYRRWHGIEVPPSRIAITAGASGGFVLAFLAAFDPGSRVAVADPSYPCYRNTLEALGIEVVRIEARLENGFQPTIADLEALSGTIDGVVIASPANPTGSMIDEGHLEALASWCQSKGVRLVSDEIYHGIVFGEEAGTVLRHNESAIVVNSFSKFFAMTGWRIGWLVVPKDLQRAVERLAQNLYISPSTIGQYAALGALSAEDELRERLNIYRNNRTIILEMLARCGLDRCAPADGAFYAFADVSRLTDDSVQFCQTLLNETGIAITPGVDFDPIRGKHFVRFSFAGETQSVETAAKRFRQWIG